MNEPAAFTFGERPGGLLLDSGARLGPITQVYETWGRLDRNHGNAVLVCHALTGDAHAAAGTGSGASEPGWWDWAIGPGRMIDTDRWFVICANVLGGCAGSTGPMSIDPVTGRHHGLRFPVITVRDMVRAQQHLLDALGIERLAAVIGGSMGGMQALQWAVEYPDRVGRCIALATSVRPSPQAIALNEAGRQSIYADPDWRRGDYQPDRLPRSGLGVARMIGHISYMSDDSMHRKFGRRLQNRERLGFTFDTEFAVESYLRYRGGSFTRRFDANSYLYLTKALDYFDLAGDGSLEQAFNRARAEFLVVSFTTDWLYPTYQSREIVQALVANGRTVSFTEIESPHGHDAFLLEREALTRIVGGFLAGSRHHC